MHTSQLSVPHHRSQILAAVAAVALAGATYGVISIATNDDSSAPSSQAPVVTKVDTSRVLDGSAILRGTANRVDTSRVLDGSPLVRGLSQSAFQTAPHVRLDGAPFVTSPPTASQPPKGRPEGFHGQ